MQAAPRWRPARNHRLLSRRIRPTRPSTSLETVTRGAPAGGGVRGLFKNLRTAGGGCELEPGLCPRSRQYLFGIGATCVLARLGSRESQQHAGLLDRPLVRDVDLGGGRLRHEDEHEHEADRRDREDERRRLGFDERTANAVDDDRGDVVAMEVVNLSGDPERFGRRAGESRQARGDLRRQPGPDIRGNRPDPRLARRPCSRRRRHRRSPPCRAPSRARGSDPASRPRR